MTVMTFIELLLIDCRRRTCSVRRRRRRRARVVLLTRSF